MKPRLLILFTFMCMVMYVRVGRWDQAWLFQDRQHRRNVGQHYFLTTIQTWQVLHVHCTLCMLTYTSSGAPGHIHVCMYVPETLCTNEPEIALYRVALHFLAPHDFIVHEKIR